MKTTKSDKNVEKAIVLIKFKLYLAILDPIMRFCSSN